MKSSPEFPARWASKCNLCDRWFARGELIVYWREPGEQEKSTVHAECADGLAGLKADDITLRQGETVCPDCHLTHQAECT